MLWSGALTGGPEVPLVPDPNICWETGIYVGKVLPVVFFPQQSLKISTIGIKFPKERSWPNMPDP